MFFIFRFFRAFSHKTTLFFLLILVCYLYPEDSDYNPADEDSTGRPPAIVKKPTTPISSSSQGRPRRKVGRPRKYCVFDEGYNSKGEYSVFTGQITEACYCQRDTYLTLLFLIKYLLQKQKVLIRGPGLVLM